MAEAFAIARDRDAWAVIRGFVYQVDLSILRWIRLNDDEILELERGEDIDTVTAAITAEGEQQTRLLEQVKHREDRITLRSDPSKAALANFFEHRRANPKQKLQFRFTTNAEVTYERGVVMPDGLPGITLWERLRGGQVSPSDVPTAVAALRGVLAPSPVPARVPEHLWVGYQQWHAGASDSEFLDFVAAFEWATLSPDAPTLRPRLTTLLRTIGAAQDNAAADALYQGLFHDVFALLSRPGIKRLTRNDLAIALARRPIAGDVLFAKLSSLHEALAGRVDELERQMRDVTRLVATTSLQLADLSKAQGIVATFDLRVIASPPLLEPPPIERASPRSGSVSRVLAQSNQRPLMLALSGARSSGKTQFAASVARILGERRVWLGLAGLDSQRAATSLALAVDAMLALSSPELRSSMDWRMRCTGAVNGIDVVVLDDLPAFRNGDAFGIRALSFASAALDAGTSVVVTSTIPIPGLEAAARGRFTSAPVPPFTADEVGEVLQDYGAPDAVLRSNVTQIVEGVTQGHPVLLHAVAQFLAAHEWRLGKAVIDDLFRNHYAQPLAHETVRALLDGVADEVTRDLLYRLALVGDAFGESEVRDLANVNPAIPAPRERFTALIGPWVEPKGGGQFAVSPLVAVLGDADLMADTRKASHGVLARSIIARKSLNELDLMRAMRHFAGAEDFNGGGVLLLQALHFTHTAPPKVRPVFMSIWWELPLPETMAPALQLYIRAYQAILGRHYGDDSSFAIGDMRAILSRSPAPPAWSVFGASLTVAVSFAADDVPMAAPFVRSGLIAWVEARVELSDNGIDAAAAPIGGIFALPWLLAGGVKQARDLDAWVLEMGRLPDEIRREVLANPIAAQSSAALATRLSFAAYGIPPTQRDWNAIVERLDLLEMQAREMGASTLAAAAAGIALNARSERGDDFGEIAQDGMSKLEQYGQSPDDAFLVARFVGHAAVDRGNRSDAALWLQRADSMSGRRHGFDRVHVKLRLAELFAGEPLVAASFAESAAMLAPRISRGGPEPDVVLPNIDLRQSEVGDKLVPQTQGELAIARWRIGDRVGSARALIAMIDRLIGGRADDDESWKSLFVIAGHVSGYLVSVITTGAEPEGVHNGPYVPAKQGMLIAPKAEFASLYTPERVSMIGIHAMQAADAIGDADLAVSWATRTAAATKAAGLWNAAVVPLRRLVRYEVSTGDYRQAIEDGLDIVATFALSTPSALDESSIFATSARPTSALGALGEVAGDSWARVDDTIILNVGVPALVAVAAIARVDGAAGRLAAAALRTACEINGVPRSKAGGTTSGRTLTSEQAWRELGRLCEDAFLQPIGGPELIARGNRLRQEFGEESRPLVVAAYLVASIDMRLPLGESLRLHVAVAQYLELSLGSTWGLYDDTVVPFFVDFWRAAFDRAKFLFRAPALVATGLADVVEQRPEKRVQRLLDVIADGLGVTLPPGAKEWLRSAASPPAT